MSLQGACCLYLALFLLDFTLGTQKEKEKFWRPDIYIYENTEIDDKSQPVICNLLMYDGTVVDFKLLRLVTSCDIDIYKFPFDKQTCNISLGSYIYPASEIKFKSASTDTYNLSINNYDSKGAWELLNVTAVEDNYTMGIKVYSRLVFMIQIQRIPQNCIVSFILPICFMVLLDIASMFIEMPKDDRLGFKISIVLGFSVLLVILNDILPLSATPPVLGIFCSLIMAAMVVSITESVFTAYILTLSETQTEVPHWVEIVFVKYLSRILCYKVNISDTDQTLHPDAYNKTVEAKFKFLLEKIESATANEETEEVIQLKNLLLIKINIQKLIDANKKHQRDKTAWSITARVIDLLFFILYILYITGVCIFVIVSWATFPSISGTTSKDLRTNRSHHVTAGSNHTYRMNYHIVN
ncbi:5-hydroxytryptamine receptor 3C-like [Anomaloglossus baeobatrachus]|uniref:5-hydroxytryptamine receptor 3C-like n=1 Tax=Anomaloglossus baeobatrachus TaxID=238106 RepID=UPI003F509AA9